VAEGTQSAVELRIAPDGVADGDSGDDGVADEQADEDDGSVPTGYEDEDDEADEQADGDDDSLPGRHEDDEDDVPADDESEAAAAAAAAAGGVSRTARRGIKRPKTAFKLSRHTVNNHMRFKKLPWRKLTKALEREWAAMGDANKEAFEARLAASKSKHERELAAWRANGGDAFPGNKEREARQEAKRRAKSEREAKQEANWR
jgi:hypothetical protein